jgi:hypothetical protein
VDRIQHDYKCIQDRGQDTARLQMYT